VCDRSLGVAVRKNSPLSRLESVEIVWSPTPATVAKSNLGAYLLRWLEEHLDLRFDTYDQLWRWSVANLEDFWAAM